MAQESTTKEPNSKKSTPKAKKKRVIRNFPAHPFEDALGLAKALYEFGGGQPVRRVSLFDDIGKSPESSSSRVLITSANKYGLIKGGYQAEMLELTPEGRKAADDQMQPRERARARANLAIKEIAPFAAVYEEHEGLRLPAKAALVDSMKRHDVGGDAAEEAVDTFIVNLRFVGLLKTLSGADRLIKIDHLLDDLPSRNETGLGDTPAIPLSRDKSLMTSGEAHFERIAFYVSPIGTDDSEHRRHSDLFLGLIVEPALEELGLTVVRADQIDQPGIITNQVIQYLFQSRLVIADLSYHNPNVFYELAIRHMLRKPVVQLMRKADHLPFDVNQVRTIVVDTTDIYSLVPQIDAYRSQVAAQVRQAIDNPDGVDSPLTKFLATKEG
ncbi:MAG: hypothetical protein R3D99_08985 [Altererythrobacter sp.]